MKKGIIFLTTFFVCVTICAQIYDECDRQYQEAVNKAYEAYISKGLDISNYYEPKFSAILRDYSDNRINSTDFHNENNRLIQERQNAWGARDAKYNQDLETIGRERDACYGIVRQNYEKEYAAEQKRLRQQEQNRQIEERNIQIREHNAKIQAEQAEAKKQAQQERNKQQEERNRQIEEHNAKIQAEQAEQAEARRQAYLEAQRKERERRVNEIAKPAQQNIDNFTSSAINATHANKARGQELASKSLLAEHNARNQGRDISVTSQMSSEYAMGMLKDSNKGNILTENVSMMNNIVKNNNSSIEDKNKTYQTTTEIPDVNGKKTVRIPKSIPKQTKEEQQRIVEIAKKTTKAYYVVRVNDGTEYYILEEEKARKLKKDIEYEKKITLNLSSTGGSITTDLFDTERTFTEARDYLNNNKEKSALASQQVRTGKTCNIEKIVISLPIQPTPNLSPEPKPTSPNKPVGESKNTQPPKLSQSPQNPSPNTALPDKPIEELQTGKTVGITEQQLGKEK